MPISNQPLAERIARVLAGSALSSNMDGDSASAGDAVDRTWPDHLDQAMAVLHTMREPDEAMAEAGDAATWKRMIETALGGRSD